MSFNPEKYKLPQQKPLPVLLLLDVSGSMLGDKIKKLYEATTEMVDDLIDEGLKEVDINIAIITFGGQVNLHTDFTSITKLQNTPISQFTASGNTPLGQALIMAKDLIEDKNKVASKSYRPAVVLVSDGIPNDEWKKPLEDFIGSGRSSKCQRFAIAIGNDAHKDMLEEFTGNVDTVYTAVNASDISNNFAKVTMSVSMRSKSVNPNVVVSNSNAVVDEDEF